VIPSSLVSEVYEKAKQIAKGTADNLEVKREKALIYFKNQGIEKEKIFEI
jgi:hypothetical protein